MSSPGFFFLRACLYQEEAKGQRSSSWWWWWGGVVVAGYIARCINANTNMLIFCFSPGFRKMK